MVGTKSWPAINGLHLATGTKVICTLPVSQVGPGYDKRSGIVTACTLSVGRYSYEVFFGPQPGFTSSKVTGVSPHEIMPINLSNVLAPIPSSVKPSVACVVDGGGTSNLPVGPGNPHYRGALLKGSSAGSQQKPIAYGISKAATAKKGAVANPNTPPSRSTRQNSKLTEVSESAKSNSSQQLLPPLPLASPAKSPNIPAGTSSLHDTRASQTAGSCSKVSLHTKSVLNDEGSDLAGGVKRTRSTTTDSTLQSDGTSLTSEFKRNKAGHILCKHRVRPEFCKKCIKGAKSKDSDANIAQQKPTSRQQRWMMRNKNLGGKSSTSAMSRSSNKSSKGAKSSISAESSRGAKSSKGAKFSPQSLPIPQPSRAAPSLRDIASLELDASDASAPMSLRSRRGTSPPASNSAKSNKSAHDDNSQSSPTGEPKSDGESNANSYGRAPSGHELCKHNIRKTLCKACKGGGICEHGLQRSWCRQCGGSARCEHGKQKSKCKICPGGGSAFCHHDKYRYRCNKCKNKSKT